MSTVPVERTFGSHASAFLVTNFLYMKGQRRLAKHGMALDKNVWPKNHYMPYIEKIRLCKLSSFCLEL